MNKLLSVIIPTRNRQKYCVESVQSILPELDKNCEIVIQDNSSEDTLRGLIAESFNNSIVVYNYNDKPLSFIDNFEEALSLSNGKYFIILGDDDSVTSGILSVVKWMDKNEIESVSSSHVVDYIWPNHTIEQYKDGVLTIPSFTGEVTSINVGDNLRELMGNGFLAYQKFNLPRTYHGIVKRSCMDEVKKMGGRYFGGLTPDIYSTVALSCVIKNHKIIDYPFSIAGACPVSATVHATVGGHSGLLSTAPHFNNRGEYHWEDSVPQYYSVETIWAETAIKALKDMKYENWFSYFNKYKLYVYGAIINRAYILRLSIIETLKVYKKLQINLFCHVLQLISSTVNIIFKKVTRVGKTSSHITLNKFSKIYSFEECKIEIDKIVAEKAVSFFDKI